MNFLKAAALVVAALLVSVPAFAQFDLSGTWGSRSKMSSLRSTTFRRRQSWEARKRCIPSTARGSQATCLPRSVNGTAVVAVSVFRASRMAAGFLAEG